METPSFQLFHSCGGGGASTGAAVVVVYGVQVLAGVAPAAPSHHNFVRGGLLWRPRLFHSDNLDAATTRGRLEQSLDRLVLNVMHRRTLLSPVHVQAGERLANIVVGR